MKTFSAGMTLAELADFLSRGNVVTQASQLGDGQLHLQAQMGTFACNVMLYGERRIESVDVPGDLVQLVAMFAAEGRDPETTLAFANRWNREKIVGKAYTDEAGDLGLELTFIVRGADEGHLASNMTLWFSIVEEFANRLYG